MNPETADGPARASRLRGVRQGATTGTRFWRAPLLVAAAVLAAGLCPEPVRAAGAETDLQPPPEPRRPVDLERELAAPWQAGGEIALYAGPAGEPRAGRRPAPPVSGVEERARRVEHFALARILNLQMPPRALPLAARPLGEAEVGLLERFALSDAGAVWFREVADDTLRLFNLGYLELDAARWRAFLDGGPRPRLSQLVTGRLSEAGLFAQDAAVFRFFGYDGHGAMAAAASIRLGLSGFRCNFLFGGEPVDPFAVLSHEFGHTRYGDPRSAGQPLGEARTVARYENPVRLRNGFPPRSVYYLSLEPGRPVVTREPTFQRVLAWRQQPDLRLADLDPVAGLYCECPGPEPGLRGCLADPAAGLAEPAPEACFLRWVAVRVAAPKTAEAP